MTNKYYKVITIVIANGVVVNVKGLPENFMYKVEDQSND